MAKDRGCKYPNGFCVGCIYYLNCKQVDDKLNLHGLKEKNMTK